MRSPDETPDGPDSIPRLWDLDAEPACLARASGRWFDLARTVAAAERELAAANRPLLAHWQGDSGQGYRESQAQAAVRLHRAAGALEGIGRALDEVADALRGAQGHLDDAWDRLCRQVPSTADGERVLFHPADQEERDRVYAAAREAREIRTELDDRLTGLTCTLTRLCAELTEAVTPGGGTHR